MSSSTSQSLYTQTQPFPPKQTGFSHACVLSHFSPVQLFVTLWTVAFQALVSMGFSRQEYWSGLPFPHPGDLSEPGIESTSLMSPVLAGGVFTTSATSEAHSFTAAAAKSLQSCPTLCDPVDCSPSGSSVHGILQANILEWIAISSSRRPSQPRDQIQVCHISCTGRFSTTETLRKS